ncbi:MAG TPA: thiosulfate oxidation carrier protein SoxY, partial [Ramlibacter sp.]|nr:thiosulfate oxidation carrier protein SoxY [Ramlibacter sp.]
AQVGRIHIGLPDIAESGNSVPLTVRVESPMTATDHVRVIHLVAERNPRPWVASFTLGTRAGRAQVETQIRLSDTQAVAAYAQMSDGSWWTQRVNVTVTIGACESLAVRY